MPNHRVLVVDDEATIRHVLCGILDEHACEIRDAGSAEEALEIVENWKPEVALLDIILPGMNGLDLLVELEKRAPDTEVVMMTSQTSADTALQAIRKGAYDYLEKPFEDLDSVWNVIQRAVEKRALGLKNQAVLEEQEQRTRELSRIIVPDGEVEIQDFGLYGELFEFFIDLLSRELDVERASLMLSGEDGDLRIVASRGLKEIDPNRVRVKKGERIAGHVALSGEPLLVGDVRRDPTPDTPLSQGAESAPNLASSFLCVPIKQKVKPREVVLGVINVTNRRSDRALEERDLAHLVGLADQLAETIAQASHSHRLQQAYESLKTTQDQLVFSERITAVGQMAAGVAHDFKNTLAVILTRAELLLAGLAGQSIAPAKLQADLHTIKQTALQGAEAIKRVQDYTRARKDAPHSPVDMNTVIREAVEIARPKWKDECQARGERVDIHYELNEVPDVGGNPYELIQVVGNLIFNAIEAMPGGGQLTFRSYTEGDSVIWQVEDTGTGMDEETRRQLFEPFFTTKEKGQGLGTSIIHGIIQRHQGKIEVDSEPGRGTTFTVTLPRIAPHGTSEANEAETTPLEQRTARVLLIDDDEAVRITYEEAIATSGHQVVVATNGQDALSSFDKNSVDVVITDMSMLGLSGMELAQEIKKLDPTMPIILLSGWSIEPDQQNVKDSGIDYVLEKPCLIQNLLDTIQEAIRPSVSDGG